MVLLGIEQLIASPPARLKGRRLGLLCNQASTDRLFRHSRDLIRAVLPDQLTCLFTPQHGFFAEKQDNMIESGHTVDRESGLPVFSLYGTERRPTKEMFDHFDVLLVDLMDVGSFVGLYPIPMRHGLTFGELALLMNSEFGIGAELEVIAMAGWQRRMLFRDTGLPFVFPSPNMPTPEAALVYPGQVIWEGTNISEGRGTALPFELCGAPFWDHREILAALGKTPLPGCILRPVVFEPTSNKWQEEPCVGFHFHVTEAERFLPYRTSLALLQVTMHLHPDRFAYKSPPYEYEYERLPLDLILGDTEIRQAVAEGADLLSLEESWQPGLTEFSERRRKVLLYS
ncbi:MAG: DUF1343 domain-containing protein [Deltaproteobacteria bacterium]